MEEIKEKIKTVFTEDKFDIKITNRNETYTTEITYKRNLNNPRFYKSCVIFSINFRKRTIYVDSLGRCGYIYNKSEFASGKQLLENVEKVAELIGNIDQIKLIDASELIIPPEPEKGGHSLRINLWALKILTTGQSWYNSLGYFSDLYDVFKQENEDLRKSEITNFGIQDDNNRTVSKYVSDLFEKAKKSSYINDDWRTLNYIIEILKERISYDFILTKTIEPEITIEDVTGRSKTPEPVSVDEITIEDVTGRSKSPKGGKPKTKKSKKTKKTKKKNRSIKYRKQNGVFRTFI